MTTEPKTTNDGLIKSQPVTNDDLYRRSSQYRLWSFTAAGLEAKKEATNKQGRRKVAQRFDEAHKRLALEHAELFAKHPQELSRESQVEYITLEEETSFFTYYMRQILKLLDSLHMPSQVKTTAVLLFRKFYLENSVMEYHPKNVLFTCIFLAAKLENCFMKLDAFVKSLQKSNPKLKEQDIVDLEFEILSSLKFTLMVHHPFRPLYGFFLDFQEVLLHGDSPVSDISIDTIGSMYDRGKKWLSELALLTDVQFLYTPPQIALASLYVCKASLVEEYLRRKFPPKAPVAPAVKTEEGDAVKTEEEEEVSPPPISPDHDALLSIIKDCAAKGSAVPETNREIVTLIDKKCFFCIHTTRLIEKKIKRLSSPTPS